MTILQTQINKKKMDHLRHTAQAQSVSPETLVRSVLETYLRPQPPVRQRY